MREPLRDSHRLEHILDAIGRLLEEDKGNALDQVIEKQLKYYGVIKLLEIIGEASYKLTKEFRDSHPATPWKYVIGMRHILVHGYYQVNRADVLKTIREDLPPLQAQIATYLLEFK